LAGLPDGEFPFTQGVEHGHFFRDGPGGKLPPKRAFALQNPGQVERTSLFVAEKLLLETLPRRNQFML